MVWRFHILVLELISLILEGRFRSLYCGKCEKVHNFFIVCLKALNFLSLRRLELHRVVREDAGLYTCKATNKVGSATWNTTLVVQGR